jgi:hypothetical protein
MKISSQEELKRKALAADERRKKGVRVVSEAKLQQQCVMWYKNKYPDSGKHLFAVFNEGRDVSTKMSMGLTPGVSDLIYIGEDGKAYGYELKQLGTEHNVSHLIEQASWLIEVLSGRGWFCDSLEAFQRAILGDHSLCISPVKVLDYCRKLRTKTVLWDKVRNYVD